MALHRPIRKAAHLPCRLSEQDAKRLRATPSAWRLARDTEADGLDERLAALAEHIHAGKLYECAWQLMKYGHFKGMEDEAAALALGNWARRNQIHIMFDVRRVSQHDVLYVLMRKGP